MTQLAGRHDLTAAMLIDDEFDAEECRRAMQTYCREAVLVPNPYGREASSACRSQCRHHSALDRILHARRFDLVNLE